MNVLTIVWLSLWRMQDLGETKYIIFTIGSLVCVPVGIFLAATYRRVHDLVFVLLVFGTCMPDSLFGLPTDINFLSREWYRGSTRGIEISYLDLLALILLFGSLSARRRERTPFFWPPSLGLLLAYFSWCLVNVVVFSDPKIFGVFELTKIARGILLFISVAAYIRSPREVRLFIWALAITIFYEAAVCLRDRYVFGNNRIQGTLPHPNALSMYCLLCVPIFMTVLFAVDAPERLRYVCGIAYVAAVGCVLLTISRTGFAAVLILSGAGFFMCTGFRLKPQNLGIALLGLVLLGAMVVKSYDSIMTRLGGFDLEQEYMTDEGDRGSYFRVAAPAIEDNPLWGVGLNNWSWWTSNRYAAVAGYDREPYPSLYEGPDIQRGVYPEPPAHNLYLLTVTELGCPGLLFLGALLLHWLWLTGTVLLVRHDYLVDVFRLGAFLSLAGVLMQSWTEWGFRQTSTFFLAHIIIAVGASLYYYHYRARVRGS